MIWDLEFDAWNLIKVSHFIGMAKKALNYNIQKDKEK